MAKRRKSVKQPVEQAEKRGASPLNGVVPPPEHRFKPGQSGNPKGRTTAGATLREWINRLAEMDLSEAQLRRLARDKRAPWTKRAAAELVLRTIESVDLADMEPLLSGEADLQTLRKDGINTDAIRKIKVRSRTDQAGITTTTREVELYDRAGVDFDRIMENTEGKHLHHTSDGSFAERPIVLERTIAPENTE